MKLVFVGLLAWLLGLLTILGTSFLLYETPGIIDITSYAVLLFVGSVLLFTLVYAPVLYFLRKKIGEQKILKLTPLFLAFVINAPLYVVLWWQCTKLCGEGEIFLFTLGFVVIGLVFGVGYSRSYRMKKIHP